VRDGTIVRSRNVDALLADTEPRGTAVA
jgi:hypothetical protein